eukprot:GFYU01005136.1.p1 GENE.GFYU01005136.1~~GFYU01005136.1.p1  ORF type:complete len:294 (+),score=114.55 GFYU01005136.1:19-900(+)
MRLVTFAKKTAPVTRLVGAHLKNDKAVVDLTTIAPTMRQFLAAGQDGLKEAQKMVDAAKAGQTWLKEDDVTLLAPISDPEKVVCVGMNYADHCHEQNFPIPEEPVIFSKFASAIAGPGDDIIKAPETNELDFEVELVIIVGKDGKRIPKEKAMEHVYGYTVAHDVSARDWQFKHNGGQWLLGKTQDGYCPIGPSIVTPDEISDVHNLGIRCILNGSPVQDSSTNQLIFRTDTIIEFCSKFFTLKTGDLILTGTPPGVGCFRKPEPLYLKDGDVVTCEIDELGSITNTIKDEKL